MHDGTIRDAGLYVLQTEEEECYQHSVQSPCLFNLSDHYFAVILNELWLREGGETSGLCSHMAFFFFFLHCRRLICICVHKQ